MQTFEIGQEVKVTFAVLGKEPLVFISEVMDIVDNDREQGVWVDHPECRGDDMMYVSLINPNINKVEAVEEVVTVNRRHHKETDMREAKKAIQKAFKHEDEDIKVFIKVYDCFEDNSSWEQFDDEQSYDVEISWAIGEEVYTDTIMTDSFYSNIEGDEVAENSAMQRAKSVLKTVKGWFDGDEQVTVLDGVEVYNA